MIKRIVIPEILDHLDASHPDAMRSRRDLRRINCLMGNERWILQAIRKFPDINHITEIGAGDGTLCHQLSQKFPHTPITAYDLAPKPKHLTEKIQWAQGDLFTMPPPPDNGILIANLFLHHFEPAALAILGRWMENSQGLIFNEPDRAHLPHLLGNLMHPWINHVTKHDMHVSIDAGFTLREIPTALGLNSAQWTFHETSTWRGARRVIGCRD